MQLDKSETNSNDNNDQNNHRRLKNHRLSLTCVCIDANDEFAFTGSKDGSIIKWNLDTKKMIRKIEPPIKCNQGLSVDKHHTKHVNCLAISSDSKFLASGGWDKKIRIWNPDNLEWLHSFSMSRQEVTALVFRQGHHMLYSGSADRSIMLWSLEDDDNRCFVESLYGHESPITSIDSLRRERILSSGGRDQTIRIWKIVEQAQTVFESKHESADIARYIDDKTFVSGGEDGSISIWTTMKRSPLFTLKDAHKADKEVECKDKLSYWIVSLATRCLKTTDKKIVNSKPTKKRKLDNETIVSQYDEVRDEDDEEDGSDDNKSDQEDQNVDDRTGVIALIASGSCDSKVKVWKLIRSSGKYDMKLHQSFDCAGFVNDLVFSHDGTKLLAACGQEHRFGRWWKLNKAKNCMRIFEINKI